MRRLRVRSPSAPLASLKSEAVHNVAIRARRESARIRRPTLNILIECHNPTTTHSLTHRRVWPGLPAIDYNGFALFNKFVPTP
jgi:hypothetical protein